MTIESLQGMEFMHSHLVAHGYGRLLVLKLVANFCMPAT
jgi:hypothetical protein